MPAVLAYLLSHQFVHRHYPFRVPKEIVIALLLTAGVGVFAHVRAPLDDLTIWLPLVLFAGLSFANCALISAWEHEDDRSHGQTSFALQFNRGLIVIDRLEPGMGPRPARLLADLALMTPAVPLLIGWS